MQIKLPHPSIVGIPQCVCTHPINPTSIHFLRCVHGNECIGTHDVICDTFATIVQDASFHMGREQLHALFSTTFNSSHRRVNNMLTKDGIHTLADIVIINSM
jgi:hypothetical protein